MDNANPIQSPTDPPPPVALTFRVTLYVPARYADVTKVAKWLADIVESEDVYWQTAEPEVEFLPADPDNMTGSQDG